MAVIIHEIIVSKYQAVVISVRSSPNVSASTVEDINVSLVNSNKLLQITINKHWPNKESSLIWVYQRKPLKSSLMMSSSVEAETFEELLSEMTTALYPEIMYNADAKNHHNFSFFVTTWTQRIV